MANMQNMNKDTALRLAAELDDGYPLTGDAISAAAELRTQHARITELEAQLSAIGAGGVSPLRNAAQETEATHLRELAAPSTDQVEEILRERDDADDFIDALLDEVLGPERPEWSSAYGRADALNDVRERMTALHKPAVDKAWDRFQSAMEAPQQPAPSPVPATFLRGVIDLCTQKGFSPENIEAWDSNDKWIADIWRQARELLAAPADSVLEDAARLDWLNQQCEGYGFQDIHEGNRWEISGPYANVRQAIDYERAARKQGEKQ